MVEATFSAWLEFGDGLMGQLISLSEIKRGWKGKRIREVVFYLPEDTMKLLGLDIELEGVNEIGKGRGKYLKREYPANYILEKGTTISEGRNVPLIRILCDMNEGPTDLTRLSKGHLEYEHQLEEELESEKAHVAVLIEQLNNEKIQFNTVLKEMAERIKILEGKDEGEDTGEEGQK